MSADDERCQAAKTLQRIDDAFHRGDVEALRAELDDPNLVPNGQMPPAIGSCLVYAIYHSPLPFIRKLLELGANPNAPVDDGFPPLIAALTCARSTPGATQRTDVDDIIRLLLAFGADPNLRGINDYTALHMAVSERNALAVQLLLDGGAAADARTRIDECETPLEMARTAGHREIAALLERKGRPLRQRLRSGLTLLTDIAGAGDPVRRQHEYRVRLRMTLRHGEPVRWQDPPGSGGGSRLTDNGETLITDIRVHRNSLMAGLFYGLQGMRVGGTRRLEIAPQLAYGALGVPGVIPPNAVLVAEVSILEAR